MIRELLPAVLFSIAIAAIVTALVVPLLLMVPLVNSIVDTICKLDKGEK